MNFEDKTNFRLREEEFLKIKLVIKQKKDKYSSVSHFIRCAIIKQLKEDGIC